jgi:DNA-3-methyladenine glycosylase II
VSNIQEMTPTNEAELRLSVDAPFRLDRTVSVLQRLPGNAVDVWIDGGYVRAFDTPEGPVVWRVTQPASPPGASARGRAAQTLRDARANRPTVTLRVGFTGIPGDLEPWRARLRRMLGLDVDLAPFHARARRIPAIAPLARLATGLRPPRFASLHEAFAAVILFQQVSLPAAIAILRRLVVSMTSGVEAHGTTLHPFPDAGRIADAPDTLLRAAGLSGAKMTSLRGAARAVASGELDEAALEALPSDALVEQLREIPGVGPWTANLLALRYFGRLDVFPPGDVAAAKALGEVGAQPLVERLGPWRGMLYYLLFARRMAAAGAPAWSDADRPPSGRPASRRTGRARAPSRGAP